MGRRVEKDGYTAELTDDLGIVYRSPRGRELQQCPEVLFGAPDLGAMFQTRSHLKKQRTACRVQAREWALAGAGVPRALADADPRWREALESEGVALTDDPGEDGLFARTYTGFDGHTLTQLLPEQLIPHRDLLMRKDHWEPDGLFATGIPDLSDGELPFPERVIAAHPGYEELAVRKVRDLEHAMRDLRHGSRRIDGILAELTDSAPALLTTLLDELADHALGQDRKTVAAGWFERARETERRAGPAVDQEWLQDRCLAYAGAGALPATALRARARELAGGRTTTAADLARFRAVVVRRQQATSELYPELAVDLRKIAKAAGLAPDEELAALLQEILAADGVTLEAEKFWTDCLKGRTLKLLAERCPEVARLMLKVRPGRLGAGRTLWPELLARTGALAQLTGAAPGLPVGAAAAWLAECVLSGSDRDGPWPVVYDLAEKIAPRLAADGVPVEIPYWPLGQGPAGTTPLDLVDLLLEHGVPVADPPELFGPSSLHTLLVGRRPELAHLRADARFARQLRARIRAELEMTAGVVPSHLRYEPHESKGWQKIPRLIDNPAGHEELRAWCDRERARLRAGVDLDELALLLIRFGRVGAAVDLLLKDAGAAQEFAAVDVLSLLMDRMPEGVSRPQVAELLERLEPDHSLGRDTTLRNRSEVRAALPDLGEPTAGRVADAVITAVHCRAGLEPLVRRCTPVEEGRTPVPEARQDDPEIRVSHRLMRLAESDGPVWAGDPARPSAEFADKLWSFRLRATHAHAVPLALGAGSSRSGSWEAAQQLLAYAAHPLVTGEPGRWRIAHCEVAGERTHRRDRAPRFGAAVKTATSAAYVLNGGGVSDCTLWEYAPDGVFPEDGPLAAAGARLARADVLEPARPRSWFVRFAELYRKRGAAPARPEPAAGFAERLGISVAEATVLLAAYVPAAPHQVAEAGDYDPGDRYSGLESWKLREGDTERAVAGLTAVLGPDFFAALYDKLLPDDPERLWTTGPDVDRAAEWWLKELGAPLPVPADLLPLAGKEILAPKGEPASPRRPGDKGRYAPLRLAALAGRVATGADCLAADLTGVAGEPDLLALPRIAAWLAYRTPAGHPLRPATGAAISRMRREPASGPGPLPLFSLQFNLLMGFAPSTAPLTAHPAVTERDDPRYKATRLCVDPAALTGSTDPLLDALDRYLDTPFPSQWLPSPSGLPAVADLRLLLSDDFAALGDHLADDGARTPGWEQHPARSVPQLLDECAGTHGLSDDPAALYLMLLALPDPTDRNVKAWTGWKPARFKAAAAELTTSGLVVQATRPRAGRSLFLPGAWQERTPPRLPLEASKLGLLPLARDHRSTSHMAATPSGPIPALFARAWEEGHRG